MVPGRREEMVEHLSAILNPHGEEFAAWADLLDRARDESWPV